MTGRSVRAECRFVGREEEWAVIADACASARRGRGRLLVVRGPAGIGKTTLCERAAEHAMGDGFAVGWGRCWSDGGAPPLWPWPVVLDELGGAGAAGLLAEDAGRSGLDPDRFARFQAVAHFLAERAKEQPLLVVIDDAHAAPAAALLLARFVARSLDRSPLVLVLTGRRESAAGRAGVTLDDLEREATVVPLSAFDERATAAFIAANGIDVDDGGLAPALARLTEGSPLLLARAMAPSSRTDPLAGVEHVVDNALGALPTPHRHVLALAAILGNEASAADIVRMAGGEPAGVMAALANASAAGLIDVAPTGWAFTHDLVRRAAIGSLGALETMEAHARALDLVPGDDRPATVIRRAHHALQAAARSDDDALRAVAHCRAAARVVADGFDYERAAELAGSAAALAARLLPPAEHVGVLLEHADALLACGRLADARPVYEQAAVGAADPVTRARAALGLGGVWVNEHRGHAERQRVLERQRRALAELPRAELGLRARLEVRVAAEAVYDGADVGPVLEALATARRTGDPRVLAEALSLTHHALLAPEHLEVRWPLADELIRVASHAGDELRTLFGLLWRTVDLYLAGDGAAERALGELRERAEAVGCNSISYIVVAIDVMRLIRSGRLDEAEAAAAACFERGLEVGDADATGYYGAHLLTIRWLQGRDVELLDAAREIADSATLVAPEFAFRATAAAIAARAGRHEEAAGRLHEVTAGGLARLPRSSTWLMGIVAVVEAARALGDAAVAAEAYELLLPFADRPIMPSLAVTCFGSVAWALGVAASTRGDDDTAIDHFERALQANARVGHRPAIMLVYADLAGALLNRARGDDVERAVASLRRAAEVADEIGASARAAEWRDRAGHIGEGVIDADAGLLRHDGKRWVVVAGTRRAVAPDLVGMHYLGTLLIRPGLEISAVELVGGAPVDQKGQALVDRPTLDAYRRRVEEIDGELAHADDDGDERRLRRLGKEREALRAELASVLAISGRSRRFIDTNERARTAVRKAIRRAIEAIAASDEAIASELRETISTGRFCAYVPDPRRPRRWFVRRAS